MKLSIIILTYNSAKTINQLLTSLETNLPKDSEIIVVDNKSTDETVEVVKKHPVKLIENNINSGFSKGNNLGVKNAKGEYLLFLNPDTIVSKGVITSLLEFKKNHPEAGLLAPRLVGLDGHIQESVTPLPTLTGAIKEYLFNKRGNYKQYVPKGGEPVEVEAVYGAAIMISKEDFEKVGGFDEKYFLFYEDIDLCRKISQLNKKIIYLPTAQIKHQLGASMSKASTMPFGVRTLAWFWPLKRSGSNYYQLKSANLYHGVFITFLIRLIMYLSIKLKIYQND